LAVASAARIIHSLGRCRFRYRKFSAECDRVNLANGTELDVRVKGIVVGHLFLQDGGGALMLTGSRAPNVARGTTDPSTGVWSATGPMTVARGALTVTMLPNGKVLSAGGQNAAGDALASSELYNPATGKWALTGKLNVARDEHTAVLLATGKVLMMGGENINGVSTPKAELFNPATGTWALTGNMTTGRQEHTAHAVDE
jgi:hypothetical protein